MNTDAHFDDEHSTIPEDFLYSRVEAVDGSVGTSIAALAVMAVDALIAISLATIVFGRRRRLA